MDYFLSALQIQMWLPYVINLNLDKFQIRFLEAWKDRDNETKFWKKTKVVSKERALQANANKPVLKCRPLTMWFQSFVLPKSQSQISSHRKLSLKNPPGVPRTSKMARHTKGRRDRCYTFPRLLWRKSDCWVESWNKRGWKIGGAGREASITQSQSHYWTVQRSSSQSVPHHSQETLKVSQQTSRVDLTS